MKHKILSALLVVLSTFPLLGSSTLAQAQAGNASNITIRPFLQNLTINPSDTTKQFVLTISNDSKSKQVFHLSTINFGSLNETGGIAFSGANISALSNKYGLAHWIALEKNDFGLEGESQTDVKVTVKNDKDLSPGAHYAAIIITASKNNTPASQLTITPKVSSLIFATKVGGEVYDIHLESAKPNGSLWQLPSSVTLRFKSTGNTFIIPRGIVSLKQNGQTKYKGVINPQSSIVLPESIRSFDAPLTKVSDFHKGLLFNKYTIQVDYRYDGNPNFATHSYSQQLLNKTSASILALLIIVPGLAVMKAGKNWRSWSKK